VEDLSFQVEDLSSQLDDQSFQLSDLEGRVSSVERTIEDICFEFQFSPIEVLEDIWSQRAERTHASALPESGPESELRRGGRESEFAPSTGGPAVTKRGSYAPNRG
jgi:hypothetical protein